MGREQVVRETGANGLVMRCGRIVALTRAGSYCSNIFSLPPALPLSAKGGRRKN